MNTHSNENDLQENNKETHDYDGIRELHNPSPVWVIALFLITIGFSGIYFIKYLGFPNNGKDQTSEYRAAMDENAKLTSTIGGKKFSLNDPTMIKAGEKLFKEKGCTACHGTLGEGNNIGPNLTDHFWLWGCKSDQIVFTIKEGRPEKGMTPFKSRLSEMQIHQLTSYIMKTLVGSNPPNGKSPQGEDCQ